MMPTVPNAAIIAGGASRRMGRDKALLTVEGEPLIARVGGVLRPLFKELIVVTARPEVAAAAQARAVADMYRSKGPLAGIHAALAHFKQPTFCVACDMPYLNAELISYQCNQLEGDDAVVPRVEGRLQPLHAIYAPQALPRIERELQRERVRPFEVVMADWRVRWVEEAELRRLDPDLRCFENWNTPEDVVSGKLSL
jgi:molybdopterin-guanine dinucleotide biosynthesis protein A